MAYVFVAQASARKRGFTATLMSTVVEELGKVDGIEVGVHHLHDYSFGPCRSCFHCILKPGTGCVREDDWGRNGEGVLYKDMKRANALLIVDPVYLAGTSAMARLFMERIYPLIWEGVVGGLPFASISCAGNQGYQLKATEEFCKTAAAFIMRYIGGLPVHVAYFEEAVPQAIELGLRLAETALEDEKNGRRKLTDEENFSLYMDTPYDFVGGYIENLTNGTFEYELSVPVNLVEAGGFKNPEAQVLLEKTCDALKETLDLCSRELYDDVPKKLAETAKYWTNATFMEFGQKLLNIDIPKNYRPLDEE